MNPGDVMIATCSRRLFQSKTFEDPALSVLREQDRVVILGVVEHFSPYYDQKYECCLVLAPCGAICYVAWLKGDASVFAR